MIKVYLKYLFKNPWLYVCSLLVAGTALFEMINRNIGTGNSLFYAQGSTISSINTLFYFDFERKIIALLAAVPFNARFSAEWLSNSNYYIITRKNSTEYLRSHLIVSCLSSFLVVALGLTIYAVILTANIPIYLNSNEVNMSFGSILEKGYYTLYIAIKIVIYSLSNTLWCVCGLLCSVFFTNPYIALCSPFIFGFLIENLTYRFPEYANAFLISAGVAFPEHNLTFQIVYSILFWVIQISLIGFLFFKYARRKIINADS